MKQYCNNLMQWMDKSFSNFKSWLSQIWIEFNKNVTSDKSTDNNMQLSMQLRE